MKEQNNKKFTHSETDLLLPLNLWTEFFIPKGKVSSRGAPGGAVKQLAFDSTTPVKTNMADEGGRADVNVYWFGVKATLTLEELFRARCINIKKKIPQHALLPGAQREDAPCYDLS